jgi:glyoxylase-like metal-dependent hydrolase (beta-lactamase superfamily II)
VIVKQFEVGRFSVFSYLIGDEETGETLAIDPADDIDVLLAFADQHCLTITQIANTHAHIDHTMGNAEMERRTGAPIIIHEAESYALSHQQPERLALFNARPSPPADILVRHGDTIQVGMVTVQIIHTPGHSPGGIALVLHDMVFTGDTLFVGAVGRTDLPGGSWETLEASILNRLFTLPNDTVVLPGHNYGAAPTSTIERERLTNPYVRL